MADKWHPDEGVGEMRIATTAISVSSDSFRITMSAYVNRIFVVSNQ